ncbi:MAG: lipase family protein [Pirellulaceae bacterium]
MSESNRINASSHFNLSTALRLASATELAYAQPDVVERTVIDRWKCSRFLFFDVEATQCFLAADQDTIIVCFRGTEPSQLEDWIVDLDFELVEGPLGGRVHAGFYDALSCVWYSLDHEVRRLQAERPRPLWVAGHSLGAALAALAVARWRAAEVPVSELFAFGQPRTGDREFARHFDFAFRPHAFRIVNDHDIITRTPPRSLGYHHLGTFIYLTDSGDLSDDVGRWQQFLDGWQGAFESIFDWGGRGVEEHRMVRYRQRIEKAFARQSAANIIPYRPRAASPRQQSSALLVEPRRRAA